MTTTTMTKTNIMEDKAMERTIEAREMEYQTCTEYNIGVVRGHLYRLISRLDSALLEKMNLSEELLNSHFANLYFDINGYIETANEYAQYLKVSDSSCKEAVAGLKAIKNEVRKFKSEYKLKVKAIRELIEESKQDKHFIHDTEQVVQSVVEDCLKTHKLNCIGKKHFSTDNWLKSMRDTALYVLGWYAYPSTEYIERTVKQLMNSYTYIPKVSHTVADDNSHTGSNPIADESSTYTAPVSVNSVPVVAQYQEGQILRSGSVAVNPVVAVPLKQGQDNNNGIPLPIDIS